MKYLRRAIALLALASLVLSADLLMTGSRYAHERQIGAHRIPPESDYVRSVYDQQVGTDAKALLRAMQILSRAGQVEQSSLLERFFGYCSIKRFLGEDVSCSGLTVRSAVNRAAGLAPSDKWPVDGPLEAKLAEALSFSLASEELLRQSTGALTWKGLSYEGPGILRYESPVHGAHLYLAARNRSAWELLGFRIRLQLRAPLEIKCSSWMPFPFYWPAAFVPQSEALAYCEPPAGFSVEDLVAAVHEARQQDSLSVWVEEFTLKDPNVRVVDNGKSPVHRFTLNLAHNLSVVQKDRQSIDEQLSRELADVSCSRTATCPSAFESVSVALLDFFNQHIPLPLIPVVIGLLMGVGLGGLFRKAFLLAGILAAVAVACIIGWFTFEFHAINTSGGEKGFALLGMGELLFLSANGWVLWFVAMLVGVLLTTPLWKPARPAG
jgi:hypothetical protein